MTPDVSILGDPDIHVKEGSHVTVDCLITNTSQPVPFVTWIFNNQVDMCKLIFFLKYNSILKKIPVP